MTMTTATATPAPRPSIVSGFLPLVKGILGAAVGYLLGIALVAGIRAALGVEIFPGDKEPGVVAAYITAGYPFAVLGWLFGIGMWRVWGREWVGLPTSHVTGDWRRYLTFCEDHKVIGLQYLAAFIVVLLVAGGLGRHAHAPPADGPGRHPAHAGPVQPNER